MNLQTCRRSCHVAFERTACCPWQRASAGGLVRSDLEIFGQHATIGLCKRKCGTCSADNATACASTCWERLFRPKSTPATFYQFSLWGRDNALDRPPRFLIQLGCLQCAWRDRRLSPCHRSQAGDRHGRSTPPSRHRARPATLTRATTLMPGSLGVRRGLDLDSEKWRAGVYSGTSSWVRLAAMMPATRATPRAQRLSSRRPCGRCRASSAA